MTRIFNFFLNLRKHILCFILSFFGILFFALNKKFFYLKHFFFTAAIIISFGLFFVKGFIKALWKEKVWLSFLFQIGLYLIFTYLLYNFNSFLNNITEYLKQIKIGTPAPIYFSIFLLFFGLYATYVLTNPNSEKPSFSLEISSFIIPVSENSFHKQISFGFLYKALP